MEINPEMFLCLFNKTEIKFTGCKQLHVTVLALPFDNYCLASELMCYGLLPASAAISCLTRQSEKKKEFIRHQLFMILRLLRISIFTWFFSIRNLWKWESRAYLWKSLSLLKCHRWEGVQWSPRIWWISPLPPWQQLWDQIKPAAD